MTDTTDTTTAESIDTDDQQAPNEQGKSQQVKATTEFFREKFADEEAEPLWIDPKGDRVESESGGEA
jgi:hypothetical protein